MFGDGNGGQIDAGNQHDQQMTALGYTYILYINEWVDYKYKSMDVFRYIPNSLIVAFLVFFSSYFTALSFSNTP